MNIQTTNRFGFIRTVFLTSLFLLLTFSSSDAADALWIAESEGVLKIATADGEILFEIKDSNDVDVVAVSASGDQVWTYGRQRLKAYSPNGQLLIEAATPKVSRRSHAIDLLADNHGVRLAIGRQLLLFDTQGEFKKRIRFRRSILSMTLDTTRSHVWLSVPGRVYIFDQDGNDVDWFWTYFPFIAQLDYDAFLDHTWLTVGPFLLRLNNADLNMEYASRFGVGFYFTQQLAADGAGGAWGATRHRLSHIGQYRHVDFTFKPFEFYGRRKHLSDLAADTRDQSVWIANRKTLKQFDISGAQQKELTPDLGDGVIRRIKRLSLANSGSAAPNIQIDSPTDGELINTNLPMVELSYSSDQTIDTSSIELKINDAVLEADCNADQSQASCTLLTELAEGEQTLSATIADENNQVSEPAEVIFTVDTLAPEINLINPQAGLLTNNPQLTIQGNLNEAVDTLSLSFNGDVQTLAVDQLTFSENLTLVEGDNTLSLTASDLAGNQSNLTVSVTLDTQAPMTPDIQFITVGEPVDGLVTVTGHAGSVEANTVVRISNLSTNEVVEVLADEDGSFVVQVMAELNDQLQIQVLDGANNASEVIEVQVLDSDLPPNPNDIAPPLASNGIGSFNDEIGFIYSGDNPIQTDVAEGAIDIDRASVIRGLVLSKDNRTLSGVAITIKDHAEFGMTLSRADGRFDFVVNGGELVTIEYQKEGYLPVQRQVNAPWQGFVYADDVVMIQLDSQVTTIDLGSTEAFQSAQGSQQSDADGVRQATILFPQGTTASMVMPNNTQLPLTTLNVRATEYTVGENGKESMPAMLPPTSGYTYAVELSVDEAISAGASSVQFSQALPLYVNNFLDFPTGEIVPLGYYDRSKAKWVAADNGRVIEVLAIQNNRVVLDVDGSGNPASQAQLDELNLTDGELEKLAGLYIVGQSLWRTQVTHFTPWDCNWPYGLPGNANGPPNNRPRNPNGDKRDSKDKDKCKGCIIEPQGQTLGETIPIVGTPYTLNYRSNIASIERTPKVIDIPLSNSDELPDTLHRIDLKVEIAGRQFKRSFQANPNQTYRFVWDGLDVFGRVATGVRVATVTVIYVYEAEYYSPDRDFTRSFARFGGGSSGSGKALRIGRSRAQNEVTLERTYSIEMLNSVPSIADTGGWSISSRHFYDTAGRQLYLGNGGVRRASSVDGAGEAPGVGGNVIREIEKSEYYGSYYSCRPESETSPFFDARICGYDVMLFDANRNLYAFDKENRQVRLLSRSLSDVKLIAGSGKYDPIEDDVPATKTNLYGVVDMALGKDGSLYLASDRVVRRIGTDGIINTVAGDGSFSNPGEGDGDGGSALNAKLAGIRAIELTPEGHLYIAQNIAGLSTYIRKVNSNGIITTLAGKRIGLDQDDILASEARLGAITDMKLDDKGNLYINSDNNAIRKISASGLITTIAGGENNTSMDEGILALDAKLRIGLFDVTRQGGIYFADFGGPAGATSIRFISSGGIINTVASTFTASPEEPFEDNERSIGNHFGQFMGMTQSSNGQVYLVTRRFEAASRKWVLRLLKLENQLAGLGLNDNEIVIAARDGYSAYVFGRNGQHKQTINAFTNHIEQRFIYNEAGQLITIIDEHSDQTRLERDEEGNIVAIVSPDGQRTELGLNTDGYLETVSNPAGESYQMKYTPTGYLNEFRDRKNQLNRFYYNDFGQLIREENAGGGSWQLERTELEQGYETKMTSAEARQYFFSIEQLNDASFEHRNTGGDGAVNLKQFKPSGQEVTIQSDGARTTRQEGADPRFGMQSPTDKSLKIEVPSGLTFNSEMQRSVVLPSRNDLFNFNAWSQTQILNGRVFKMDYDASTKTFTETSAQGRISTTAINEKGQPDRIETTGLNALQYTYDLRGRLSIVSAGEGVDQRVIQMTYYLSGPQQGYLESLTDAENQSVSFEYDLAGRIKKQTLPDTREINYEYDANGNLSSITPPGRSKHIFNHNAFDQESRYIPPTVAGINIPQTIYDYNLDKELIKITRPDGKIIDFNYNNKAQLTSIQIPRGDYAYSYNAVSGQLANVTAPQGGELVYTYDGFLNTGVTWTGDVTGVVTFTHDNDFRIATRSINGSNTVDYTYDNDSLLTQVGSITINRDEQKDGLITGTELGDANTARIYNDFGELVNFDANYAAADLYEVVYTRDKLGRIKQKQETIQGEATTDIYTYDLAGRLETVNRNGVEVTYRYDSNGNRTSKEQGSVSETGVYDEQDRLQSYANCAYTYNDNGELETKTCNNETTQYSYDVIGNLISVILPNSTIIEYEIDGQDRRIGKRVNGELQQGFLYQDQLNPVAELDSNNNIVSQFIYGTKINVPDYMIKDNTTYRIISDHLGSPRLVINTNTGDVIQRIDYDEFGHITNDTNPGFQPFGFAGGIYDQHTTLTRFGARDYSSEIGRWASKDPIKFDGGVNLYGYSLSDPVNLRDTNGLIWHVVAGAAVGGAFGIVNAAISGQNLGAGLATGLAAGAATAAFPAGALGSLTGSIMGAGTLHMAGGAAVAGAAEYLNQKLNGECVNALGIKAAAFGGLMGGAFGGLMLVSGFGKTVAAVTSSGFSGAASMGAAIGDRMSRSGR